MTCCSLNCFTGCELKSCPLFPQQVIELDLSTVVPSVSGPKRPHDRVAVSDMKEDFQECLGNKIGFKGFGIPSARHADEVPFSFEGSDYMLKHGKCIHCYKYRTCVSCKLKRRAVMAMVGCTVQHSTVQYSTAQLSSAQQHCAAAQHSTAQHSTAQNSIAQLSSAQLSTAPLHSAAHVAQHNTT